MAAKMAVLLKAPERVQSVCADIAQHFHEKVEPNGFGAQVVTSDRESFSNATSASSVALSSSSSLTTFVGTFLAMFIR